MTHLTARRTILTSAALAVVGSTVSGCSLLGGDETSAAGPATDAGPVDASKSLVAFLSVPLTDEPDDMTEDQENSTHVVDGQVLGNVQYVAQLIAARTGAETFRIDTVEPLPGDYEPLADLALQWQDAGTRPELKELVSDMADYDTIFVGYPIWWYDLPQPMYSFLEGHDFAGKTVVLFSVHGGSRLSGTDTAIAGLLPQSTVIGNALTISRDDMNDSQDAVNSWLDDVLAA